MVYQMVNFVNNQFIKMYLVYSDVDVEVVLQQVDVFYYFVWVKGDIELWLVVLYKLVDLIDSWVEELVKIVSQEMGKFIKQSCGEVKFCVQIVCYYVDNVKLFLVLVKYFFELGEVWVEYYFIGVLLVVELWNFFYYQLICVFVLNLVVGNLVIVKYVSIVLYCVEIFVYLVCEVGVLEGVWINLFIFQDQVVKIIVDDCVQGVVFIGLEKVGSVVVVQVVKYIKKLMLELGGNDVFVVLDDVDLECVVKIGVQVWLNNVGQVCIVVKCFILYENIVDVFLIKFSEVFCQVKIGDLLDESIMLGLFFFKDVLDILSKQVDEVVKNGVKLYLGGKVVV